MIRDHLNRALLISAGLLVAAAAAAQAPQAASAGRGNGAPQAQNAGSHGNAGGNGNGNGNGAGNGNGGGNANGNPHGDSNAPGTPGTPGAKADGTKQAGTPDQGNASERGARMKAEHESERAKLMAVLHAPLDDAAKQELKKHALRIAYLQRIKALATAAKDQDALDRAAKLLDKENARHDKWIASLTATAQSNPTPNGGAR